MAIRRRHGCHGLRCSVFCNHRNRLQKGFSRLFPPHLQGVKRSKDAGSEKRQRRFLHLQGLVLYICHVLGLLHSKGSILYAESSRRQRQLPVINEGVPVSETRALIEGILVGYAGLSRRWPDHALLHSKEE